MRSTLSPAMRVVVAVVGLVLMCAGVVARSLDTARMPQDTPPVDPGGKVGLHGSFDAAGYDIVVIDNETALVHAIPRGGGHRIEVYRGDLEGARAWVLEHSGIPAPVPESGAIGGPATLIVAAGAAVVTAALVAGWRRAPARSGEMAGVGGTH